MTTDSASASAHGRVGLACDEGARRDYVADADIARLEERAEFTYRAFSVASGHGAPAPRDFDAEAELASFAEDLDVLLVWDGAPFVSAAVLEAAGHLSLCGELEGDRFAYRLDLEAAQRRGIRVVDTSHGSSFPAAEWALEYLERPGVAYVRPDVGNRRCDGGKQATFLLPHGRRVPATLRGLGAPERAHLGDCRSA